MNKIKGFILILMTLAVFPNVVQAASGNIKVTGSSTAVVGNTVTVTVSVSSGTSMGGIEFDLDYDRNYLKLTSSTASNGGSYIIWYTDSAKGTKSKSFTFKFKTLKSGSTKISVDSYNVFSMDEANISISTSSKTIRIMTQSELEATYSSDATLKSLSVDGHKLSPEFKKTVYEYNVEVENDVTSVTVNASKNDSNASLNGTGAVDLEEGNNKVEITVTAQKGNSQTYTVNIYRKELNPIEVVKDGVTYKIVRKADNLISTGSFKESTVKIDNTDIPALYNEATNITLVGVKDDNNEVKMYVYDNELKYEYMELTSNQPNIIPLALVESSKFKVYDIIKGKTINGIKTDCYALGKASKQVIVYAMDTTTGNEGYYLYDMKTNTFSIYRGLVEDRYNQQLEYFKYIVYGLTGLVVLLLLICIFKKGKQPKQKQVKLEETKEDKKVEEKEEVIEEEIIIEEPKEEKKKSKKVKEETPKDEEKKTIEEDKVEEKEENEEIEVVQINNKKLTKEEKQLLKEQKRLLKEQKKLEKEEEKRKKDFDF